MGKLKKSVGTVAVTAAILFSALPASAAEYVWVRDAYPNMYDYVYDSVHKRVQIWRDSKNYFYVDCDLVEYGKCFVKR
ncbi:hypothetical protein [Bacillus sonorensis]|uniref:hypothetical protein n=1 Tax=Bacillus sonorensis TaxID=119858 RepID=UPI000554CCD7|nr:hypothetical protein [Bacillus sonorensis]